jgi:hypothetical protein
LRLARPCNRRVVRAATLPCVWDWLPAGVEVVRDVEAADWAVSSLAPWAPDGVRLASFMPSGFEAYARVLHPAPRGDPDDPRSISWAELANERGVALTPDVTLAEVLGVDGEEAFGSFINLAPQPGHTEQIARPLSQILRGHTGTPALCWFCVWEGWGFLLPGVPLMESTGPLRRRDVRRVIRRQRAARRPLRSIPKVAGRGRNYLLLRGSIETAHSLEPMRRHFLPASLWWPDDRAWAVATEIDGFSTYVGGKRSAIDALLGSSDLEAIEVTLDVRMS